MDNVKQQIVDRIKQSNNILVTVRNNPSVDQLAACIGLTLMLNKLGKHGTAVFSGQVPPVMEFLQPEKTIEKDTNSLRDFIIALDKSKADKLRYKVEDKVVKIFITPYRTSITDKDLQFSQGDFNVDVVIALGVQNQADLDQAIAAHGRILHDAAVISINDKVNSNLGSLNWLDKTTSGLSEVVAGLDGLIGKTVFDGQIATALLTGIVAQTDRFSNNRTSSQTMAISSKLIAAGANQQLVATKLAPPPPPPKPAPAPAAPKVAPAAQPAPPPKKPDDGTIKIDHGEGKSLQDGEGEIEKVEEEAQIHIDDEGNIVQTAEDTSKDTGTSTAKNAPSEPKPTEANENSQPNDTLASSATESAEQPKPAPLETPPSDVSGGSPLITQPPTWSGQLTANTQPDSYDQGNERSFDPLNPTLPPQKPLPNIIKDKAAAFDEISGLGPEGEITESLPSDTSNLNEARNAVDAAMGSAPSSLQPSINPSTGNSAPSTPLIKPLRQDVELGGATDGPEQTMSMPMPNPAAGGLYDNSAGEDDDKPSGSPPSLDEFKGDGGAPPPVPPPLTPPVF